MMVERKLYVLCLFDYDYDHSSLVAEVARSLHMNSIWKPYVKEQSCSDTIPGGPVYCGMLVYAHSWTTPSILKLDKLVLTISSLLIFLTFQGVFCFYSLLPNLWSIILTKWCNFLKIYELVFSVCLIVCLFHLEYWISHFVAYNKYWPYLTCTEPNEKSHLILRYLFIQ